MKRIKNFRSFRLNEDISKEVPSFDDNSEYSELIEFIGELSTRIDHLGYKVEKELIETNKQIEFSISIVNDDLGEEKQLELIDVIGHILRYANLNGLLSSLKTYFFVPKYGLDIRAICTDETEIFKEIKDIYGKNKEVVKIDIELFSEPKNYYDRVLKKVKL